MVISRRKVVIDQEAKKSLHKAFVFIRKDSLQNAEKVRNKILTTIKELPKNPELHKPDKYRIKNVDGSYRAFEVFKYRVSYYITADEIRVIRIRHTKMNPLKY